MKRKLWVLFIMNEADAEPIPVVIRPFTRFEMRRMEQHVKLLEGVGVPARFDPVREEVVDSWTAIA
ncbi:hypothetical protein SEA_HORTUS1_88 [Microbacterium phage Hortus1]|nr:hypothetical protein SEA_HORTUS1_88 [Microbacterium phage Hortus1]AWY05658.1 hypothetical protein SEA_OLINDD_88 [Microbacterium phage OlinDD]AWY05911.1 hypothetical protein SEA_PIONEER3_88 [Microbacterium phage Pioneer3]AWY06417.1 hypothetical protein SEA_TANDEM_88 [Microbacterium phage Tandem]QAU07418.1 hypothetical protein SEA_ALLEB_86 [Microbacterium phage Alleb]